jgi:hypothetical protein
LNDAQKTIKGAAEDLSDQDVLEKVETALTLDSCRLLCRQHCTAKLVRGARARRLKKKERKKDFKKTSQRRWRSASETGKIWL